MNFSFFRILIWRSQLLFNSKKKKIIQLNLENNNNVEIH